MIDSNNISCSLKCALDDAGFGGTVTLNAPLASHTSYGIGGPASLMAEIPSVDDLVIFKTALAKIRSRSWSWGRERMCLYRTTDSRERRFGSKASSRR